MCALRIGIIGGGPSGATATKACLEQGFSVVVFERTHRTGGLWRYHNEDVEGIASVAKSTIINSSKEMSSFSDFPAPPEFPNYMHNTKMVEYFDIYGKSFDYEKYVKFHHEIINLEPSDDYEQTGRWKITAKNLKTNEIVSDVFDGVMVCTGHHVTPLVPTFKNQHKFKGSIIHTHSYKKPEGFEDKVVVVVGIGNSGGDAAVELSTVAKKVYLSTRRGTWVVHRVGPNGRPFDGTYLRRFWNVLFEYTPYNLLCNCIEYFIMGRFDHTMYQIKPKHRILAQHVMINDSLPNRILSGTVVIKPDIQTFTENGIIFEGETEVTPCDAIILATGYRVSFPFISQSLMPTESNKVELYKYVFKPDMTHPQTLAFIALVQSVGALLPCGEMQARWFALLMAKKLKLPSREEMMVDIRSKRKKMEQRYYACDRHTMQVDFIPFLDELASIIGVKPNLVKYFFVDPKLWSALFFGPCVPYQYRLQGPNQWSGARQAILTVEERIDAPLKTRVNEKKISRKTEDLSSNYFTKVSTVFGLILFILIAYLLSF